MLLWAPGGRGKTALVVRWVDQLPPSLNRVFVPISIRAGTNVEHIFYEALATRLALLLGEPPPPLTDAHHTRERVQSFLASFTDPAKPCVVVIDGLDEATGWQVGQALFSRPAPPGLKILVSARQLLGDDGDRGWRNKLGWRDDKRAESLEVLPLGRAGIADVLARMGLATLSRDTIIVDRLFQLTDNGEPLLVELYATDLRDPAFVERLHRLDPRTMVPGLRGFFNRWFTDQVELWARANPPIDKDEVYAVLAILACAVGALRLADIQAIAKHADLHVNASELDAVERFVVRFGGDAVSDRTYVLTHPRLGDFLRHESEKTEIYMPRVRAAFRAWGAAAVAAVNALDGAPAQVPRYLLIYYLHHLTGDPPVSLDRFRDLAENGWRVACTEYGGGEGSLSEQLETCFKHLLTAARTAKATLTAPRTGLGGLIHIALCLASLRSLGTSIPPSIMAEMVRTGLLLPRRALFLSRVRREPDRAAIIAALAPVLTDPDRLLLQAEARRLRAPKERVEALLALARHAPGRERLPLLSEALANACKELNNAYRQTALNDCLALAATFDPAEEDAAFNLAEQFFSADSLPKRQRRQTKAPPTSAPAPPPDWVASPLPAREIQTGWEPAVFIRDCGWRLRTIPPELEQAHRRLAEARSAATIDDMRDALALIFAQTEYHRLRPIALIAPFLPSALVSQTIDAVLEASEHWLGETLRPLAARLDGPALLGLLDRLLVEPLTVHTPTTVGKLFPLLSDQQMARLWPSIATLTPTFQKIRILREVVGRLGDDQLDLLVDPAIPPDDPRDMADYYRFEEIAEIRDRLSTAQLSRLLTESLGPGSRLLSVIAPKLSPDLLRHALAHTFGSPPGWTRTQTLKHLLPIVAENAPDALQLAAAAIRSADTAERLSLLEDVLPSLPADQRRDLLLAEQQEAFKIGDRLTMAVTLACLDEFPDLSDLPTLPDRTVHEPSGVIMLTFLALLPRIDADRARGALQLAEDGLGTLDLGEQRTVAAMMALCPKLSALRGSKAVQKALALLADPARRIAEVERAVLLFSPHLTPAEAQHIASTALRSLEDTRQDANDRLALAAFLAEAPHISKKSALEALDAVETALSHATTPPVTRALLLAALQLCRRVDRADLPKLTLDDLKLPPLDADEEREFALPDLARFAVLPYVDGPTLASRTLDLVERAARMERASALILLSLVEGSWGDTLGLRPDNRTAQPAIKRAGGPQAAVEAIAAIRAVAAWWP